MSDIKYNINFEKLCNQLHLGAIITEPKAMSGGFLHRMFEVDTTSGKFAIKALNPQIMQRPTAMQNYINSELVANFASFKLPALAAKRFNDTFIHEIENQFYLVFDFVEGKSLKPDEITEGHCEKIGITLADLHRIDFSKCVINYDLTDSEFIQWKDYLNKGLEVKAEWVDVFNENISRLYEWSREANESEKLLSLNMVLSHRDLDPKNVLWCNEHPLIIDWEAAGPINPMHDLIETVLYWSINEQGNIDKSKFFAFIKGYKSRYKRLEANWHVVLANGYLGKLGWLEFNLKRSLWIECTDVFEQQMGTNQVFETINSLKRYHELIPTIENWLCQEI